ncbi:hypothetical protein [Bacillus salacetis]|uniref:hypothetical protein n=1 Tax=Bacillus salacetis TaxID=2315464 RepID=UPI001443CE39|nr:hypothetical protein [Bacillus salacetis]
MDLVKFDEVIDQKTGSPLKNRPIPQGNRPNKTLSLKKLVPFSNECTNFLTALIRIGSISAGIDQIIKKPINIGQLHKGTHQINSPLHQNWSLPRGNWPKP